MVRPAQFPLLDALACASAGIDLHTPHASRPRNDAVCLRTPLSWGRALPFPNALGNADLLAAECRVTLRGHGFSVPELTLPPGVEFGELLYVRKNGARRPGVSAPRRGTGRSQIGRNVDGVPVVIPHTGTLGCPQMSRLELLKCNPLMQDVPEAALNEVASVVTERHLRPGETLLAQDAQGEALHLLIRGIVRVSRVSLGSRERVMGDVYAPGVLGETAILSALSERSATVVALTEVTTLMLYRSHFEQLLRRHPVVLWNLGRLLAERVTTLNDELIAFGLNTEAALSHVFTHLYHQRLRAGVPQPQVLPLGAHDIMLRISSSRETVSRVMRKLEKQGLLTMNTSSVILLDPEGLERVPLEEPDPPV